MNTQPKVPVGLATVTGYITAVLGVCTTAVVAITGSEAQLHGPGKWAAILGIVALTATNAGRQLQAHGLIKASVAQGIEGAGGMLSPTLEQELANQPPGAELPPEVPSSVLQSVPPEVPPPPPPPS